MHRKFRYGVPLILAVQIALILLTSCKSGQAVVLSEPIQGEQSGQEHSPNVFLVMYDERVGKEPLRKAVKSYGCEIIYDYNTINGMALKKPDGRTLEETMQYFRGVKGVLTVEYDHIIRLTDPAETDQRRKMRVRMSSFKVCENAKMRKCENGCRIVPTAISSF